MHKAEVVRKDPDVPIEVDMMSTPPPRFLDAKIPRLKFNLGDYPQLLSGTHRVVIGRIVGNDLSTVFPEGYIVVSGGKVWFLSADEAGVDGFISPHRECMLPTKDGSLMSKVFAKEDLRHGGMELDRFEIYLNKEKAVGNSFVLMLEEVPKAAEKIQINGRLVGTVVLITAAALAAAIGGGIGGGLIIEKFSPGSGTNCCDHQEE